MLLIGNGTSPKERRRFHSTLKGLRDLKKHFDIRHRDAEFGVFPDNFQSCFGSVFPCYAPFPMFWNSNVYHVPLYVGSMWSDFYFKVD